MSSFLMINLNPHLQMDWCCKPVGELDRESLLQSVEMGADLGIYFDLQNSRLTMDVPIESQDFFAEEYFEIFLQKGTAGVPNLIDLALGSVLTKICFLR